MVSYGGYPIETPQDAAIEGKANGYHAVLGTQVMPSTPGRYSHYETCYGPGTVDHTATVPEGLQTREQRLEALREGANDNADEILTRNANLDAEGVGGDLDAFHVANNPRYASLWGPTGGRRPHYDTIFPLQALIGNARPHDPYRLLAAAVRSGNRHALPALVDLLKRRDNPAGWYSGWSALAKAMDDRIGDLPVQEVNRRAAAIAKHTAKHSSDSEGHRQLMEGIAEANTDKAEPDLTGYAALADHMEENGLPQYAQLLRLELANALPQFRATPKRKGSRL